MSSSMQDGKNTIQEWTFLSDYVLVKEEEVQKTSGGIFLAESSREKSQMGVVMAVGPGRLENGTIVHLGISVGDRVLYQKYSDISVNLNGEELKIVEGKKIIAVCRRGQ